jgi:hypothetical protein
LRSRGADATIIPPSEAEVMTVHQRTVPPTRAVCGLASLLAALALALGWSAAAAAAPTPFDPTVAGRPGLVVGITEPNPAFVWPAEMKPLPEPFARWRAEFAGLHPALYRLVLDWPRLQPDANRPPNVDLAADGCSRGVPPCHAWKGVREQIAALAARRRRTSMQVLVTVTGTPDWAVSPPSGGCVRPTDPPRSRAPRDDALPAYERLVETVLRVAKQQNTPLRFWTAWNEPNHPYFLTPQRAACDKASPTLAVATYLKLVRALDAALTRAPGEQQQLLGELAGSVNGSVNSTGATEFIGALPTDVLCKSPVWLEHVYNAGASVIDAVVAALDAHHCARPAAIWLTEAGIGESKAGPSDGTPPPQDRPDACQRLHAWLTHLHATARVTAAFQYTFREDPIFRTGLVPAGLDHAYRTLRPWQVWGARTDPTRAPTAAQACG